MNNRINQIKIPPQNDGNLVNNVLNFHLFFKAKLKNYDTFSK